ncbi:MAG: hypothetical protein M1815_001982 [Lichina confinis]|nr:MAG: hypothetical protein M1815_001982 [Lichina confinis]
MAKQSKADSSQNKHLSRGVDGGGGSTMTLGGGNGDGDGDGETASAAGNGENALCLCFRSDRQGGPMSASSLLRWRG